MFQATVATRPNAHVVRRHCLPVARSLVERCPVGANGGSSLVSALEAVRADIKANVGELVDVVLITGSGLTGYGLVWGHFGRDRWIEAVGQGRRPEVFIGGETLAMGAEWTLQTMLHEIAHELAMVRDVADTSRGHRYHNRKFLAIAEELGLTYPSSTPDASIGYSSVVLTDDAKERYASTLATLESAITLYLSNPLAGLLSPPGGGPGGQPPGGDGGRVQRPRRGPSRNLMKFTCSCDEPRILRMAPKVYELGAPECPLCNEAFA